MQSDGNKSTSSRRRIPLSDLSYDAEEEQAVLEVLKTRWLSSGPQVEAFESEFAAYVGVQHAMAVANATAALHMALVTLGIGPGDEVIQPAINFVATANMTLAAGATPVFADICSLTEPIIDPEQVARLITPRTKAVVVMYYGGYLGRTANILEICRQHNVPLIEDACHAVGARARVNGKKPGGIGDIGCFSFFSNKNLATGEGGMITTNRPELVERMRLLRSHGMTTMTWQRDQGHASSYDVRVHGYNYRLDEIHAALGRVQLRKLDSNNDRRRLAVAEYHKLLGDLPGWSVPFQGQSDDSACHLMVAVAPDTKIRNRTAEALKQAGVQTSLHYPSIPTFEAFAKHNCKSVPISDEYAKRTLTLPLFAELTIPDVNYICDVIRHTT